MTPIGAAAALTQLHHLYRNLIEGGVRDTAQAKRIAGGLLAPAIAVLERVALASAAQPASAPAAVAEPVAWLHDDPQRYDVIHAEVKDLLVKSRDAAGHLHRPLDKSAHYTIPLYTAPAPAAQGAGNSGFDHKTAADFLSGKTISDEAVRKFVQASRWAHDEKASLSAMLISVRGELASREAEIALLKKALLEAEAAPQQEAREPAAVVVPCRTPSGKRVALYSAKQDLPIGTQLYTAPQPSPTTKPAPNPAPAR